MFAINPFAELSASIPPAVMKAYVVLMIVLVAAGTLFDIVHMQDELSLLFGKRNVHIAGPEILENPYRRRTILPDLQALYES